MRDLFADLFAPWAAKPEKGVTGVTGVPDRTTSRTCNDATAREPVTRPQNARVTGVTTVTRVTNPPKAGVTSERAENTKRENDSPELSHMSHVTHVNARCSLADCLMLLDDMHAGIRAIYEAGALALLESDLGLQRRFEATEARIDQLAKVFGGPTDTDFRAAVEAHAAVWRELSARQRARRERQADTATTSRAHGTW